MRIQDRKDVQAFVRGKIREGLAQCTQGQVEFFHKLYGPVRDIKGKKLGNALDIIERTIKKNETGRITKNEEKILKVCSVKEE